MTLIDPGKVTAIETAAALEDLKLTNGRSTGGTARYFVSDTPETFAELETLFLGEYAGGPWWNRSRLKTIESSAPPHLNSKL